MYVTSRFREAKVEASRTDARQKVERWAIAVVRDPFLLRKFTADVDFTLTSQQKEQKVEDRRRSSDVVTCVKCRDLYIESENNMGACNFHDGFVYNNLSLPLHQCKPSEAIKLLNLEEYMAFQNPSQKEEIEKTKTRFKYICCFATVQVDGGFQGCKKGKYGFDDAEHISHDEQTLDNKMIDKWETACMENSEYNKRWEDLFETRNPSQVTQSVGETVPGHKT
jgi:hypothetical protein